MEFKQSLDFRQPLLFVLGKGGVGRTSVCCALALRAAQAGRRVLVVQWGLEDSVGPMLGAESVGHEAKEVVPGVWTMNFQPQEAIREYFTDYLGFGVLYRLVLEHRHVQQLFLAAPGVGELFFLSNGAETM